MLYTAVNFHHHHHHPSSNRIEELLFRCNFEVMGLVLLFLFMFSIFEKTKITIRFNRLTNGASLNGMQKKIKSILDQIQLIVTFSSELNVARQMLNWHFPYTI